jgi:hypothetical protein
MKFVWTIVALLLLGGIIVLLQPAAQDGRDALSRAPEISEAPTPTVPTGARETKSSTVPPAAPANPQTPSTQTTNPRPTPPPIATTPPPAASIKRQPTSEPPPPAAAAIANGQPFEPAIPAINNADVRPSKFVKVSDGVISVDDTWTIRGAGTDDSPYEISWEFLSSAQDDYMPRLGERKIPARIAFLSGKRVKIAGYLAFPLVAPTSSECLLMLNQWDGCCIGIPPTPYDAIEVKLATEIKGWKRHTINFGSIEGNFKVEPYLVENWLVGLYLIEAARLDSEL